MSWQQYSEHQPRETTHCFCIHLITHTYNTIYNLKSGRSTVVGHVLTVNTCSFYMHKSHRHDSIHPSLFMSWGALLSSGLPSCKQRMGGIFFFSNFPSRYWKPGPSTWQASALTIKPPQTHFRFKAN